MQFSWYKMSGITLLIAKFYNHLFPLASKKFIKWGHRISWWSQTVKHRPHSTMTQVCQKQPDFSLAMAPRYAFLFSFHVPVQAAGDIGGTYTHKCPKTEGKSRLLWKCGLLGVNKKVSFKEEKVCILFSLPPTPGTSAAGYHCANLCTHACYVYLGFFFINYIIKHLTIIDVLSA